MKRRQFIKKAFPGLPLLFLSAAMLEACAKTTKKNKKVVVVGAGISGLAAAKRLSGNGFDVVVLESQPHIGGRVYTNRTLAIPFDEGASWIHGITGNPLTTLAQQAGMTTFETVDESRKSFDVGGVVRDANTYDAAETSLYNILNTLYTNGNKTDSFQTVFNQSYPQYANDRLWKFLLSTYVTFDTGDLNQLSSLLYHEGEEFTGPETIATNGYDTLTSFLSKGLNIQLNEKVQAIDYSGSATQVKHTSGSTVADYVLVTVPLGVLKAGKVQFSPALPATKLSAIQNVGMNCVNKFLLIWDTRFWDDVQYLSYTPAEPDYFNYFLNVQKFHPATPALMTFAYADAARQTEIMTDADVTAAIMLHLKDMYGSSIPSPGSMLRTRWQSNEHALGSYSYTSIQTEMHHFDDLAESISNRVFFAGEHTHIDYFSTAHGAYLSGLREADKIIKL